MQVTWTTPNAIDSSSRGAVPPQEPGRVAFRASGLGATSFLAVADLSADENDGGFSGVAHELAKEPEVQRQDYDVVLHGGDMRTTSTSPRSAMPS